VASRKLVPFLFSGFLNDLEDHFKILAECLLEIAKKKLEVYGDFFLIICR
jgi:hypothetical protein